MQQHRRVWNRREPKIKKNTFCAAVDLQEENYAFPGISSRVSFESTL